MLEEWAAQTERMTILLAHGALTLPEVLTQAAQGDGAAAQCLREASETMRRDPKKTAGDAFRTNRGKLRAWEREEDRKTLEQLMDGLSHGTLAVRQGAAAQGLALLRLAAETAGEKAAKDAKLYATLGWTAGLCLTIVLL